MNVCMDKRDSAPLNLWRPENGKTVNRYREGKIVENNAGIKKKKRNPFDILICSDQSVGPATEKKGGGGIYVRVMVIKTSQI